jgi:hypothetical protein
VQLVPRRSFTAAKLHLDHRDASTTSGIAVARLQCHIASLSTVQKITSNLKLSATHLFQWWKPWVRNKARTAGRHSDPASVEIEQEQNLLHTMAHHKTPPSTHVTDTEICL